MKSHKAILKTAYAVIGLSIVAVIALTVYQRHQIKKMGAARPPAISENKPSAEVPENFATEKTTLQKDHPDIDELDRHRAAMGEIPSSEPASEAEITKDTDAQGSPYAALFKKLMLSPEKQDAFKALLLDLQMQKADLNIEMLDTSILEEKREEILQHLVMLKNEGNEKARQILGADNFAKYLMYEERLNERTLLTAFFRSFGPDEKLTETREQAFIDAMFEERKKVEAASPRDNEIQPLADLEEQISRVLKTTDQIHSEYMKVADRYLTPSQTERFKNYLHQRRDMMEMSLITMRQVFGSNPASNQSPGEPDEIAN